jgi:hypothetical protein
MMSRTLDENAERFLRANRAAAMVTLKADGTPHVVRCGVAVVDAVELGHPEWVRTRHLRRDPRASLFLFNPAEPLKWLGIEAIVTILEGPEIPRLSVELFEVMQAGMERPPGMLFWNGKLKSREEFIQAMVAEQRLIYEFAIARHYGAY